MQQPAQCICLRDNGICLSTLASIWAPYEAINSIRCINSLSLSKSNALCSVAVSRHHCHPDRAVLQRERERERDREREMQADRLTARASLMRQHCVLRPGHSHSGPPGCLELLLQLPLCLFPALHTHQLLRIKTKQCWSHFKVLECLRGLHCMVDTHKQIPNIPRHDEVQILPC